MRNVRVAAAVFVTYIVLAVCISTLVPGKAHSQSPPPNFSVKVTNTPLSISGNVTAAVTGTVSAAQSGSWSVNVGNSPTVNAQQSGVWNVGVTGTPSVSTGLDGKLDTANGHLADIEDQTSKLSFNGDSLKVSPQGTQDVSVAGGSVTTLRPVATRAPRCAFHLGINGGHAEFPISPAVNATGMIVGASRSFAVKLLVMANDANGNSVVHEVGNFGVDNGAVITFPQRLQVVGLNVVNPDLISTVDANITLIGDNQQ